MLYAATYPGMDGVEFFLSRRHILLGGELPGFGSLVAMIRRPSASMATFRFVEYREF